MGLLALLNVITKVEVLIGVVLAVLAVQALSTMMHGVRIKDVEGAVGRLKEAVDTDSATTGTVSASVRTLSKQYERSRMVLELSSREAIAEAFARHRVSDVDVSGRHGNVPAVDHAADPC